MVSFSVTLDEARLIARIARRAVLEANQSGFPMEFLDIEMDITACHASGCPLDLQKLLDADLFNFLHDVFGIRLHIDRATGKLRDVFSPRFSKREEAQHVRR